MKHVTVLSTKKPLKNTCSAVACELYCDLTRLRKREAGHTTIISAHLFVPVWGKKSNCTLKALHCGV